MEFDREKLSEEFLKDFDDTPEQPKGRRGGKPEIDLDSEPGVPIKILFPLVIIVVIFSGVYLWKSGKLQFNNESGSDIPLIKADTNPIRVVPEDPGGMYIANRDKLIYETISNNEDKALPKVVKILPRHEEPIERDDIAKKSEELFKTLPTKIVESNVFEPKNEGEKNSKVEVADSKGAKKEKVIIKKQELLSSDVSVAKDEVKIVEKKEVVKKEEPITVDDIKNIPTPSIRSRGVIEPKKSQSGIKIQLGSFRTEGDVKKNWQNIKKKHDSLLSGMVLNTQKADLGDKGVFYRLRVGNLNTESEARKLCKKLIEQKQGCFVVKK